MHTQSVDIFRYWKNRVFLAIEHFAGRLRRISVDELRISVLFVLE